MIVRAMADADLDRVAALSEQLGYPVARPALRARFHAVRARDDHAAFVAERDGVVVGWIHLHPQVLLETDAYAEIGGLVVDREARRTGAGRRLVERGLAWARERGFARVVVHSNAAREEAHRFYPALGFVRFKTQHVYELRARTREGA